MFQEKKVLHAALFHLSTSTIILIRDAINESKVCPNKQA